MAELVKLYTAADVAAHVASTDDKEYVWNFAYGANLNPTSLTTRRKIYPECSVPGVLYGYELRFNCRGFPAFEPGFANVQRTEGVVAGAQVHGVLHKMTRAEADHLMKTEGGGGYDDLPGYNWTDVDVMTYTGVRVRAFTLCMSHTTEGLLPSPRYLTLIRNGAAWHRLHPQYQAWLRAYPANNAGWGARLYLLLCAVLLLPLVLALVACFALFRRAHFTHKLAYYTASVVWFLHCQSCRSDASVGVPAPFTLPPTNDALPYDVTVSAPRWTAEERARGIDALLRGGAAAAAAAAGGTAAATTSDAAGAVRTKKAE